MKRTTVMLPEDTVARLENEAERRGTSLAQVVRDAVEEHLRPPAARRKGLSFFALGEGGPADASERVDELVSKAVRKRTR